MQTNQLTNSSKKSNMEAINIGNVFKWSVMLLLVSCSVQQPASNNYCNGKIRSKLKYLSNRGGQHTEHMLGNQNL